VNRPLGIVLAGGASSRFGRDKVTAEYGGRPLVHHALERLAVATDRIVLVLAPGAEVPPLPAALVDRIDIAHDGAAHQGPLAGLAAALDVVPAGAAHALLVGADMPHLEPTVLELLVSSLARDRGAGATLLESNPTATLPMAIDVELARLAANALLAEHRRSLRGLLDALHAIVIPAATWRALDPDARTLDDIDLPTDR
jgi:molybdopterin-guanine dinucleotide biosynthesis protein A